MIFNWRLSRFSLRPHCVQRPVCTPTGIFAVRKREQQTRMLFSFCLFSLSLLLSLSLSLIVVYRIGESGQIERGTREADNLMTLGLWVTTTKKSVRHVDRCIGDKLNRFGNEHATMRIVFVGISNYVEIWSLRCRYDKCFYLFFYLRLKLTSGNVQVRAAGVFTRFLRQLLSLLIHSRLVEFTEIC